MAIARGEPTVRVTSIESFAKVLSGRDRELPPPIAREKPDSFAELPALAGRAKSNLSGTLKTMSRCRLVEVKDGNAARRCRGSTPRCRSSERRRRETGYCRSSRSATSSQWGNSGRQQRRNMNQQA